MTVRKSLMRNVLLLGESTQERINSTRVIIFGIGGVGSWCVESLARSGIGEFTLVDNDCVAESNINRQLVATYSTVGQPKVEIMKRRILDINPQAKVTAIKALYCEENAALFHLEEYDYVIDAIDSLKDKALLILSATASGTTLFSSMGAAMKLNPLKIQIAEFWKVKGCPLAAALRRRFKHTGLFPKKKFKCVYSEELVRNDPNVENEEQANGTVAHATAVFGLNLAALVIESIRTKKEP